MKGRLHVAVFGSAPELLAAAKACRASGLDLLDAYAPFPVHGLDGLLGLRRSRLPWVTLAGGATGLSLALLFQYWATATDYPLDVGGKPWDSFPAFVPVAFEMLVLLGGLATAAAFLLRSRLRPGPPRWLPDPRVTDDRFVLVLRGGAPWTDQEIQTLLGRHGALDTRIECW